jgi:aryl-alcohol dehydrogenase-like predicted oxidoreductase
MKFRQLGTTNIFLSEIGFGAWGIGGVTPGPTSYGPTNDKTSLQALKKSFDVGINFYDTSNVYGQGHSEELIGQAFKAHREKVIIATKAGLVDYTSPPNFSLNHIKTSLEGSLQRLKTDYVDLLQLHNPTPNIIRKSDHFQNFIEQLKKQGKIRAFGVSVRSPEDGFNIINQLKPDAIQVNFNLLDHRIIDCGLMELATKKGVSIIARTPLCFGFLTGNFSTDTRFKPNDHRSRWSKNQLESWLNGLKLMIEQSIDLTSQGPIQFALRFCLSFNSIVSVIPGMLTKKEVLENSQSSAAGPLTTEELLKIKKAYQIFCSLEEENISKNRDQNKLGKLNTN